MATTLPLHEHPAYDNPQHPSQHSLMNPQSHRSSTNGRFHEDSAHSRSSMDFPQPGPPTRQNGHHLSNAPPPHRQNGDPRNGNTMSLGGFEGSRSPPTKSEQSRLLCWPSCAHHARQTRRMCRASSSVWVNVRPAAHVPSLIISTTHYPTRRASTLRRYDQWFVR